MTAIAVAAGEGAAGKYSTLGACATPRTTSPTPKAAPKPATASSASSTWVDRTADTLRANEDSVANSRPSTMSRSDLQALRNYMEAKVVRIRELEGLYNLATHAAEFERAEMIEDEINNHFDDLAQSNVDISAIGLIQPGTKSVDDWMMNALPRKL